MNKFTFPELKPRIIEKYCRIIATGSAFPETIVTNEQIINTYGHKVTDITIQKTYGVKERRVAEQGLTDTDLLYRAAIECLNKAGIKPEQLSKLIVNKFIGDRALPMTASFLQKKLNCPDAIHSFDVDGGTNSFLYSFDIASSSINSGDTYILIASGGIVNLLADRSDPRHAFLYGDGAAAILLGPSDDKHIESSYFYTNYEYADLTIGFSHCKSLPSDIHETKEYGILYNQYQTGNWKEAEEFILDACQTTVDKLLTESNLKIEDIDLFLLTENNLRLWQAIVDRLGINKDKTISVIKNYGNTFSAMLPILIDKAYSDKRIVKGNRIMLLSVGEGINGGGLIYTV